MDYQRAEAQAEGENGIFPGNRIVIKAVGSRFSGTWLVERVVHDCAKVQGGFTTTVHLKRNKSGDDDAGGSDRSVSAIEQEMVEGEGERKKEETRNRIGNPVQPMNKTFDMALNPELYAESVAKKYGINLKGSGQKISIKYNPELVSAGKTRKANPKVIEIGPSALVSEEELANTIAHELNHARSFIKGGPAPEWGVGGAYPAGNSLAEYIRGER